MVPMLLRVPDTLILWIASLLYANVIQASPVDPAYPTITPCPRLSEASQNWEVKRDIFSDVAGGVSSVLGGLGSAVPSYGRSEALDACEVVCAKLLA